MFNFHFSFPKLITCWAKDSKTNEKVKLKNNIIRLDSRRQQKIKEWKTNNVKRGRRRMGLGSLRQRVTGDMASEWWVSFNLRFCLFFKPKIYYHPKLTRICRNGQNSLKLAGIWPEFGFYPLLLYLFLLMEGQFSIYRLALINRQTNLLISFKSHGTLGGKKYLTRHTSHNLYESHVWINYLEFPLNLEWGFITFDFNGVFVIKFFFLDSYKLTMEGRFES